MRVIGIDQSYTAFGFSVDGEAKKKGFPARDGENPVKRLARIRSWFEQWLALQANQGLDLVVMEGYANAAKFGREQAGELGAVVKLAIYDETDAHPLIVPPTSLKKFVTGSGGAKKNQMLLHVYRKWGAEFGDDNQADAYSLEKFGHAYLNPSGLTKYEREAVEAVRKVN